MDWQRTGGRSGRQTGRQAGNMDGLIFTRVRCILNVYQRIQTSVDMTLAIKAHFSKNINPLLTQIP